MAGQLVVVQGRASSIDDRLVDLPEREGAVFRALLRRGGAVVSKDVLLRSMADGVTPHALEATIARLRRRLGPAGQAIRSVRGRGYLIAVDDDVRPPRLRPSLDTQLSGSRRSRR